VPARKTYGGVEMYFHVFLTVAVEVQEWLASRSGHLCPGKKHPVSHSTGSWVGNMFVLEA
jgi:hypothetical protein